IAKSFPDGNSITCGSAILFASSGIAMLPITFQVCPSSVDFSMSTGPIDLYRPVPAYNRSPLFRFTGPWGAVPTVREGGSQVLPLSSDRLVQLPSHSFFVSLLIFSPMRAYLLYAPF